MSTLKANNLCINCLRLGHFVKQCRLLHCCRKCQKPHHTLLHVESKEESSNPPSTDSLVRSIACNAAAVLSSNLLLMKCRVLVDALDGSSIEAQTVLDSASSASFVSECLVQTLCLPRSYRGAKISGVAGLTHNSPLQSIASLKISAIYSRSKNIDVTAVVVPCVTCDLPLHPIPFNIRWKYLEDITLSDPHFGHPGRIDLLLEVDVFIEVLMHGRWISPVGAPIAFETLFDWVLAGKTDAIVTLFLIMFLS